MDNWDYQWRQPVLVSRPASSNVRAHYFDAINQVDGRSASSVYTDVWTGSQFLYGGSAFHSITYPSTTQTAWALLHLVEPLELNAAQTLCGMFQHFGHDRYESWSYSSPLFHGIWTPPASHSTRQGIYSSLIYHDLILSDFDPTTINWTTAQSLTYENFGSHQLGNNTFYSSTGSPAAFGQAYVIEKAPPYLFSNNSFVGDRTIYGIRVRTEGSVAKVLSIDPKSATTHTPVKNGWLLTFPDDDDPAYQSF